MKYVGALLVGISMLCIVPDCLGSPKKAITPFKASISPGSAWSLTVPFKGGERANVIVYGDGKSYLALYVYDKNGNCVAKDDARGGQFLDDRWVIWFPPNANASASYTIEVRNLGIRPDGFTIAIR